MAILLRKIENSQNLYFSPRHNRDCEYVIVFAEKKFFGVGVGINFEPSKLKNAET
jgi:hypothetical protein